MELDPRTAEQRRRVLARLVRWIDHTDLVRSMRRVTEASARSLGVARVGVWLFDEDRVRIRCVDLFDASTRTHTSGAELTAARYPVYFDAVLSERDLTASDAVTDPRTRELAEGYLLPLGITAMLDVPLWVGGHMVGVICHEHVGGGPRAWTSGDQLFAASIGDLTALALEASELHRGAEAVHEREAGLREARTMEALGQLAGDVARDLEPVVADLRACVEDLKNRGDPDRRAAERIQASAELTSALVRRLLEVRPEPEVEVVDLGVVLRAMVPVLERIVGPEVRLSVTAPGGEATVLADRHQLEQVLLNLALHGRDAMPSGGELHLAVTAGPAEGALRGVTLTARHTGPGTSAEIPDLLSAPARADDHLPSLWLVLRIVTASGGRVVARSTPGEGSTWEVELPWADPMRQAEHRQAG